jgi:hypothetical protein
MLDKDEEFLGFIKNLKKMVDIIGYLLQSLVITIQMVKKEDITQLEENVEMVLKI